MKYIATYTLLCLLFANVGIAQNEGSSEGQKPAGRHQYNFAQSYVGVEGNYLSGISANQDFGAARLVIGGTHFWYRADFYISFPLHTFSAGSMDYSEGVITGGRYLPFGPGKGLPHPFVGIAWATPSLRSGEGAEFQRSRLALDAGLSLVVAGRYTLETSLRYMHRADALYPVGRTEVAMLRPPRYTFTLAAKRYFDFTAGNASPQGQAWLKAADAYYTEHGGLSTWFAGFGASANVVLRPYAFAEALPFLPATPALAIGPDVSLGYHFHRADMDIAASYRNYGIGQEGHGYVWHIREQRIGLEAFKFLFDYKGFVPFIGPSLGVAHQRFESSDSEMPDVNGLASSSAWSPAMGVVLGWDIKPSRIDWFILRTNTRLVWTGSSEVQGIDLRNRHFEVNFIQMVIYPERIAKLKHIQP